jgi:hypothetical protein
MNNKNHLSSYLWRLSVNYQELTNIDDISRVHTEIIVKQHTL